MKRKNVGGTNKNIKKYVGYYESQNCRLVEIRTYNKQVSFLLQNTRSHLI